MNDEHEIRKQVRKSYAKVVEGSSGCSCGPNSSCCGGATTAEQISGKVGYSAEEMGAVPDGSNLGLGCGNPLAHAAIHEGDTVLDLGSGAGFDCFLAARKVGKTGQVIGVDMTHEMLMRARENAKKSGATNVEFRLGEIEALPVADNSVDLIISNCVINLSPDKARVFREAYRVLKPGGLLMVSDIVLTRDLPEAVRNSVEAYASCIAGASLKDAYLNFIRKAHFSDVEILEEIPVPFGLAVADPLIKAGFESLSLSKDEYTQITESVKSVKVKAIKRK
jgi:ubiquinone/menaquinone biosynthesis C-methylase UbiE